MKFITTEFELRELINELSSTHEPVVFDTETTGLNTRKDKCMGIGIAISEERSFYIPCYVYNIFKGVPSIEAHPMIGRINELLEHLKTKRLIAHNSFFDVEIVRHNFGVDLWASLYADTIMLIHTLQEDGPFGLKVVARELWGADELNEQKEMKASIKKNGGSAKEFYKADWDILGKYCAKDCELTYRVFNHYEPLLDKDGLREFFYDKEVMPLYKTVTRVMQQKGIPLDMELLNQTKIEILADLEALEDKIQASIKGVLGNRFEDWFLDKEYEVSNKGNFAQALVELYRLPLPKTDSGKFSLAAKALQGIPDGNCLKAFLVSDAELDDVTKYEVRQYMLKKEGLKYPLNLRSKAHLGRVFFSFLKEKPISFTQHGLPQVDEGTLEILSLKYEWVKDLVTFNKLNKIYGTYVSRFLEEQEDGIFYPEWKQFGTTSSRFSGDMQQLPRILEEEEGLVSQYNNRVRNFFKVKEGFKFVDADYSSLEVVVFAHDSRDEALLDMIRKRLDLYSYMAISVWDLRQYSADKRDENFLKKHLPEKRQAAKSFSLGIRYGLESYKLHKDLGIEQQEAELIVNRYFKMFPGLKVRMDELRREVCETGKVRFESGRIRHLPEVKEFADKYGIQMLNNLELWKQYHDTSEYEDLKKLRKRIHSMVNNAFNSPIQGYAAHIVNQASIEIMKEFELRKMQAYIAAQIHDEILIYCPEEEAELVKDIMRDKMENTITLRVPLEAEPIIGERYGEVK